MQDSGVKDPFSKVVQEHWSTFAKCMIRNKSEAQRVGKAWEYTWKHLSKARHPWRKCAGPIGAMICYLKELGFEAADLSHWKRQGRSIHIKWGDLASIRMARQEIDLALQQIRLELIASQTGGGGSRFGLDWTTHHRLLKRHSKRHDLHRSQNGVARSSPSEGPWGLRHVPQAKESTRTH